LLVHATPESITPPLLLLAPLLLPPLLLPPLLLPPSVAVWSGPLSVGGVAVSPELQAMAAPTAQDTLKKIIALFIELRAS
jgi:hypothetical protein